MRVLKIINGREQYTWEPDVNDITKTETIFVLALPAVEEDFGPGGLRVTECGVINHDQKEVKNDERTHPLD